MHNARALLGGVVLLGLSATPEARGDTNAGGGGVLLGQGYDGAGGTVRGPCVQGTLGYAGAPRSTVRTDRPMTEAELRAQLGLTQADGTPALGIPAVQVLSFLGDAAPRPGTIAVTFGYDVRGKQAVLNAPTLSALGQSVAALPEPDRLRACGDEAVTAIELGGSLFVTLRFDFVTRGVQDRFAREFDFGHVSSDNLAGKLSRIGSEYQGKVEITLGALQIGGDVSKLWAIFGNPDGDVPILRCQVEQVDRCAQAMAMAHEYIVGEHGFREQLGDVTLDLSSPRGPAMLSWSTQSYAALGLTALAVANPSRDAARAARLLLATHHARIWSDIQALESTLALTLTAGQQRQARDALATARQDAALLGYAMDQCGSRPELCTSLEAQIEAQLRPYSMRVVDAPEWFLPLCVEASLGTGVNASVRSILEYFGLADCVKAAEALAASHALILRQAGVSDARVFAWLEEMQDLDLRDNSIATAAPFATLPHLRSLNLAYNQVAAAAPLADAPALTRVRLQGNPASDLASLRGRLTADSYLTEDDVCRAARREQLARGVINQDEYARYEQGDLAPVFAAAAPRTITRWAPCAEAARALDP